MSIKRIFVVGKNRSGTKWLSNLLANHQNVAAVQRVGAGGIIEVNEFTRVPRVFGAPEVEDNYLAYLACLEKSNLFKLTGLPIDVLYEKRHSSYLGVLSHLLDTYARRQGKSTWVQKADSQALESMIEHFSDARIIIIQRKKIADNIASSLALHWQREHAPKGKNLIREAAMYAYYQKLEERFRGRENVLFTSYEELAGDTEGVLKNVCRFCDLEFQPGMMKRTYKPNTSFSGKIPREAVLAPSERTLVSLAARSMGIFPLKLFKTGSYCARAFQISGRRGTRTFHPDSFSVFRQEIEW